MEYFDNNKLYDVENDITSINLIKNNDIKEFENIKELKSNNNNRYCISINKELCPNVFLFY